MVYSDAVVDKLTREGQLLETELTAIVGCGENEKLPEWGEIDFRKEAVDINANGYAKIVKVGPFVYGSMVHSLDEKGNVVGVKDSEIQESYAIKQLTESLAKVGVKAEEVVKFKGYYTQDFGPLYGETETPLYEKVYKPVKPLYTGVFVSSVGKEEEIFTMEVMAVRGCCD